MTPVHVVHGVRQWQRRDRARQLAVWLAWLAGAAVFVACWRMIAENTIWAFVWDAPQQGADLLGRMVPPRWSYLPALWRPLWDTINMATLGTVAAIGLAVPVAFLAARNTTPSVAVVRPLALLVIVGRNALTRPSSAPAMVSIEPGRITKTATGYVMLFKAVNVTGGDAADVQIEARLLDGDRIVETSFAVVDYVPGNGRAEGGLYFEHDPAGLTLRMRPLGYEVP